MKAEEKVYLENEGLMTVRHLRIRGTNFEIGRRIGELAIKRYGKSPAHHRADPVFSTARRAYFQRNYPIHWERTRGVAAAYGIDAQSDNYDFTFLPYHVDLPEPAAVAPGCSVVYYPPSTTATGRGYLSRNYDFSTGTMADLLRIPIPPPVNAQLPAIMGNPYIMEWHPEDGGYASLAIQAFDLVSGTLDGINSAGLVVSILADEEALAVLGPRLEMHIGPTRVTGVHELQMMRWLLDTCATVEEAKEVLLLAKQYYWLVPCHYIVADRSGRSFIYENSTGRNVQHIIDGNGKPQVISNFQVHQHPDSGEMPPGGLTLENNAFWRYATLSQRLAAQRTRFSTDDMKTTNACVNIQKLRAEVSAAGGGSIAANVRSRTLWHALYDQYANSVEYSFYLRDETTPEGSPSERRSEYLKFGL